MLFLLVSLFLAYRFTPGRFLGLLVLAIPFLAFGVHGFNRYSGEYARAMSGVRAEDEVARALGSTGGALLLNGVLLGAGDIDHVLLGPVAAAIETKYGRGRISVSPEGRLLVGSKVLPRDPIAQAARNAAMLSRRLGVSCTAVVVISSGEGQAFMSRGVYVTSLRDLPALVRSLPRVLPVVPHSAHQLPVASETENR